ncbi:hypothetical protein D3C76_789780 [compost metagenome]|uniref:hypothetical protein n=1 Tax=Pseudomonas sp. BF-RE-29 TaxID=2832378 RepID=UPI000F9107B0|nr:hypothetical protein [Pseudomonas sp. BF-RE-29]
MSLEQKASIIELLREKANTALAVALTDLETEQIADFRAAKLAAIEGQASMLKALGIYSSKQAISLEGHALFVFNRRESALPHPDPEELCGG